MNDLTQLMERATDDLRPDVAALVGGAASRGRRLRTRRRLASGLGAFAGVAATWTVVMVAPAFVGGDTGRLQDPIASAPTTSEQPEAVRSELPSLQALREGRVVTLPAGESKLTDSWGSRKEGFVAASWRVTPESGGGPGQVVVLVEYADAPVGDEVAKRLLEAAPSAVSCGEDRGRCTRQPDGSRLSVFSANEPLPGGGDSEIVGTHASLWTEDGLHLSATAYNALGEKATAVTRRWPVLDGSQLAAMLKAANLG